MKKIYKITLILLYTTNLHNKLNASDNPNPVIQWYKEASENLIFGITCWRINAEFKNNPNKIYTMSVGCAYINIGTVQIANGCLNTATGCCILATPCCYKHDNRAE